MDVDRIVKEINTSISNAKRVIDNLSEDERIELRAELEASKTHFGKWMNSFMVFFAGILAILALKPNWANEWIIAILIFFDFVALLVHCWRECKNAEKVRALSILNDCLNGNIRITKSENSENTIVEEYKQLKKEN